MDGMDRMDGPGRGFLAVVAFLLAVNVVSVAAHMAEIFVGWRGVVGQSGPWLILPASYAAVAWKAKGRDWRIAGAVVLGFWAVVHASYALSEPSDPSGEWSPMHLASAPVFFGIWSVVIAYGVTLFLRLGRWARSRRVSA